MRALRKLVPAALAALFAVAALVAIPAASHAGTIIINNTNAANVGFNDPSPRAPVGGC